MKDEIKYQHLVALYNKLNFQKKILQYFTLSSKFFFFIEVSCDGEYGNKVLLLRLLLNLS